MSREPIVRSGRPAVVFPAFAVLLVLWTITHQKVLRGAEHFAGRVVTIVDGDTIGVLRDGREVRVRLDGIDCPERGQEFGTRAKQFTSDMLFGQTVDVDVRDVDRYGRLVARLSIAGRDVSVAIVEAGFAWHYKQYSSDEVLADAEQKARAARRGLWGQSSPVPPWTYRKPEESAVHQAVRPVPEGPYHGNAASHVLHAPRCRDYNCKNCKVNFGSVEAGVSAGYRPHLGPGGCLNR